MDYWKNRILKLMIIITILAVVGGLLIMLINMIRENKKTQTTELAVYFESVTGVSIKDLCQKEEGEITYTRKYEKADICFTLKTGGTALLESRFEEIGYSVIRDPGSLPGLGGYQYADQFKQEDILGWFCLFETVKKPLGARTSAEILIYITRDQRGIEHAYVFR